MATPGSEDELEVNFLLNNRLALFINLAAFTKQAVLESPFFLLHASIVHVRALLALIEFWLMVGPSQDQFLLYGLAPYSLTFESQTTQTKHCEVNKEKGGCTQTQR